mgnify:CR=1 FL=1
MTEINWGPTGELVYNRTYSRTKPDGTKETWPETVQRVVDGNLALVPERYQIPHEREDLIRMITEFKLLPAGRHLWASGVHNAQHLFNCFSGDTLVHTEQGVFPIKTLAGQTHNVLSAGGEFRPARFDNYGRQQLWCVELSSGEEFLATQDHSWVTYNSGVTYRHKTVDLAGKELPYNPSPAPYMGERYWEGVAHGIVYGDGTLGSGSEWTNIHLFGEKRELSRFLVDYSDSSRVYEHDNRTYIGTLPGHWKTLPGPTVDREYARGFIVGLIASDGYAKNGTAQINTSVNPGAIHRLVISAGLVPGNISVDSDMSPFDGSYKPSYRVGIRGWSIDPDRDLLRPLHRLRFGESKKVDGPRTVKVKRVWMTEYVEDVFCAVEPETHTLTVGSGGLTGQCWVSGWPEKISDHFQFTFMRLMEGGGVGANYSNANLKKYGPVIHPLQVHIVCDSTHPDYEVLSEAGVLSKHYSPDWEGAFPIQDSREGWADALSDLIDTHYCDATVHYQRVYDVSRIRPAGAKLKTFGGQASGPLPFAEMLQKVCRVLSDRAGTKLTGIDAMEVDHAIAQCVVAGGVRRSARMSIMHWSDPQIEEFIDCKAKSGSHWTTNISVEVDDNFWQQCNLGEAWHASKILQALSEGAVRNGEPGMWDSSLSNVGEPNEVVCTNPCGEITLQEWEPCNLGHINLAAFVNENDLSFDEDDMFRAHRLMTRFLIRATFSPVGDPKSREVLDRNRRIGVGHLGVASFIAMQGLQYSEVENHRFFNLLLRDLANEVDEAAASFSHELRIPVPVKKRTIAPTGTVAKLSGVSEGIHPIFSRYFIRRVRFNKLSDAAALRGLLDQGYEVEDDLFAPNTAVVSIPTKDTLLAAVEERFGVEEAERLVQSAADLTLTELLGFQALYQSLWADNAVSFTANVDPDQYTAEDVSSVLLDLAGRIKGSTIFPEASFPQSPYERISKQQYEDAVVKAVSDGVDENCTSGSCPIK